MLTNIVFLGYFSKPIEPCQYHTCPIHRVFAHWTHGDSRKITLQTAQSFRIISLSNPLGLKVLILRMKKDIHPEYHIATVTCSCGNSFQTGSTKAEIRVELCSACHPFFTGKQKIIDTAGKVEKFKKRMEAKKDNLVSKKEKRAKIKAEKTPKIT